MRINELKQALEGFDIFSIGDIRKVDQSFNSQRLSEWQEKGYIKKIVKGFYCLTEKKVDENFLYIIANKIYSPSYISLESAFAYYNIIPEGVYSITSISTNKTKVFETYYGTFSYKTLKPKLMFGYNLVKQNGKVFKLAEPSKALLDFLYLNPQINCESAFKELRFNEENIESLYILGSTQKLMNYLDVFQNSSLEKRLFDLFSFLNPEWGVILNKLKIKH